MATEQLFGIADFARSYISDITHHEEVHTEHLAESLRSFFGLPPFPTLTDLTQLCRKLGVAVKKLPSVPGMDGANIWAETTGPEIYLSDDLKVMRAETTICHEIREVIENAFKRCKPSYVGLDTSHNKVMNIESDHFAGCLLMQADASRRLLVSLGFDLVRFSRETGRSLPSVVLRLQSLYSLASGETEPHAGVWLFEAAWPAVQAGHVDASLLHAKYQAQMCGFSLRKTSSQRSMVARGSFPRKGTCLADFGLGRVSLEDHEPIMEDLTGFDIFTEHDYIVVVEPIYYRTTPWRLLALAIRKDGVQMFDEWLHRLNISAVIRGFQTTEISGAL
ncbi:MAG TPA: hypothetical protein VJB57_21250 [Dehalococcoidia bacterium]|nr:hypothetical protein [Dehalococcoidia bacterium]